MVDIGSWVGLILVVEVLLGVMCWVIRDVR